jgi:hypothetical protein
MGLCLSEMPFSGTILGQAVRSLLDDNYDLEVLPRIPVLISRQITTDIQEYRVNQKYASQ